MKKSFQHGVVSPLEEWEPRVEGVSPLTIVTPSDLGKDFLTAVPALWTLHDQRSHPGLWILHDQRSHPGGCTLARASSKQPTDCEL